MIIVLIAILILIFMVLFPLTEGRAKDLDFFSIYSDPFLLYGYFSSIPLFIGLYKAFKLFGYLGQNKLYSISSLKALSAIKHCAIILTFLIVLGATYIRINHSKEDDPTGFLVISAVTAFFCIASATVAAISERIVKNTLVAN